MICAKKVRQKLFWCIYYEKELQEIKHRTKTKDCLTQKCEMRGIPATDENLRKFQE